MTETELHLDAKATALVLIDLQAGIVGLTVAPHDSAKVVANGVKLAEKFRTLGATVCLVNVNFSADRGNMVKHPVDNAGPGGSALPAGWDVLVPAVGPVAGDLLFTKHNWGAFYGTALDLELRRRGVTSIVLGGISTNLGVESTARAAYEHNYGLVFAEDAMASHLDADAHRFAITKIFPRIGRVRSTEQVLAGLV